MNGFGRCRHAGCGGAVDREARMIHGVSVAQAVEALGHELVLDSVTLDQLVACGNARTRGVKSRFTHPGLSADGLGPLSRPADQLPPRGRQRAC